MDKIRQLKRLLERAKKQDPNVSCLQEARFKYRHKKS